MRPVGKRDRRAAIVPKYLIHSGAFALHTATTNDRAKIVFDCRTADNSTLDRTWKGIVDEANPFVGSSSESLDVAYAAQRNLEDVAEVVVWTQGIFELGLFIGRLGRESTLILMPKSSADFHLPTDLLGVSTATFQPPSRPERLQAALGPAYHDISSDNP
jgi:predicted nucleotide-binding protein